MSPSAIWVLVLDEQRGSAYELAETGRLRHVPIFAHEEPLSYCETCAKLGSCQVCDSLAARLRASGMTGQDAESFLARFMQVLAQAHTEGLFDAVIVVATPPVLPIALGAMTDTLRRAVRATSAERLAGLPLSRIEQHVKRLTV